MTLAADVFLEHFGVKGMRWGQRKARRQATKQDVADAKDHLKTVKAINRGERNQTIRRRTAAVALTTANPGAAVALAILDIHGSRRLNELIDGG